MRILLPVVMLAKSIDRTARRPTLCGQHFLNDGISFRRWSSIDWGTAITIREADDQHALPGDH